ncbi:tryptophan ABC transporter substrate-binding protein [Lapidilactobacillus luobeiensis]|uniref:tryptophan ABC transporter substrate-binding protein n=1 Tax=Lapidilactobacillus luobeiensis TaxID=2950371 RepID=UPI0021C324BC|nr:tryptophan ABC transporter substrate-binding protein [Lapidilactobacillus luobeiensis]
MGNRRLRYTIIGLTLLLIGGGFLEQHAATTDTKTKSTQKSAQRTQKKVVGILQYVSHPALDQIKAGVISGLRASGYSVGKNLTIKFQNGQADQSKLTTMSQQLVQEKADVLVGIATPAAQALANTTQTTPIVLGAVTDPVSAGLVQDMQKPCGNITGVSDQPPLASILTLARQLIPASKTVGILYSSQEANSKAQVATATAAATKLGLKVIKKPVATTNEIATTVQVLARQVDFLLLPLDNTLANAMSTVVAEADRQQLPVFPAVDTMVRQGGLATVGINQRQLGIQTGKMVAQILSGQARPAKMPVYTFKRGDLIINQDQAQRLGIKIHDDLAQTAKFVTTTKGATK